MRSTLVALFLTITALVANARAAPSAADTESARELLRHGNELRASKDLRGALARYKAAHALVGTAITGFEVGRTHVQLGELVEGYDALLDVARLPLKPNESSNTALARKGADQLAHEIEPRIPRVRVFVRNVVNGATLVIQIDGKRVEHGIATRVNPGKHALVVQADGGTRSSSVSVSEGEHRDVEVTLDPPIQSEPPPPLVAGPGKTPAPPPSTNAPSGRPSWVWAGFGVAGVAAIAGTVAGIVTLTRTHALGDHCPDGKCPPSEHDRLRTTERWATVSTVSFAVAGAAAAVSIVGLIAGPSRKTQTGSIRPTFGFGSIGLEGSF